MSIILNNKKIPSAAVATDGLPIQNLPFHDGRCIRFGARTVLSICNAGRKQNLYAMTPMSHLSSAGAGKLLKVLQVHDTAQYRPPFLHAEQESNGRGK